MSRVGTALLGIWALLVPRPHGSASPAHPFSSFFSLPAKHPLSTTSSYLKNDFKPFSSFQVYFWVSPVAEP